MTPRQAATRIGCTPGQVRTLIRNGTLRARKVKSDANQLGYRWSVTEASVAAYAAKPQTGGWPRGEARG